MLPQLWSIPAPKNSNCTAGSPAMTIMKYIPASCLISSAPPSQPGRLWLMQIPVNATITLNVSSAVIPCRRIFLAPAKSFAPIRWAACTEKPAAAAEQKPPNSQVQVDIRPTDAAALTPRFPTIAESMNCISTDESCAKIAGILIMPASFACCPKVIGWPPRSIPKSMSLLIFPISDCKGTQFITFAKAGAFVATH